MPTLTPDEVLLGLIAAGRAHGYHLLEHFRQPDQLGLVWALSTSQLYAVLKRLETRAYIVGEDVPAPDAPTRTEYSLTAAGEATLEAWLEAEAPSASVRRVRVEFLSRLYVARLLNRPTAGIVARQRAACLHQRVDLTAQRDGLPGGVGYLALELQLAQLDAILSWISRCELRPLDE